MFTRKPEGHPSAKSFAESEDGFALATVVAISAVLFIMVTMIIMLAVQLQISSSRQVAQTKALQVADAGINAGLYALRHNWDVTANPTLGPVTTAEGSWTVTGVKQGGKVLLTSVGGVPSANSTRTVVASIQYPTFADYMFFSNTDINIGAAAIITGQIRANGDITNAGTVDGTAWATGSITGAGYFLGNPAKRPGSPTQTFSSATTQFQAAQADATADGTLWADPGSGYIGYRVIFNGTGGTVQKVTAFNSSTGALTLAGGVTNFVIPASGCLYFSSTNDAVWVSGTYSAAVTIATASTLKSADYSAMNGSSPNSAIYVIGNLVPQDPTDTAQVCGLMANGDVSVACFKNGVASDTPDPLTVTAGVFCQTGSIHADMDTGDILNTANLNGSFSYFSYSAFVTTQNGNVIRGFRNRNYTYDARLYLNAPPEFPTTGDTLRVATWVQN